MDIFDVITRDHKEIKRLLATVEDAVHDAETRKEPFHDLKKKVTAHSRAEEKALYERLKEDDRSRQQMLSSEKEHNMVDQLFMELSLPLVSDENWAAKFQVLKEHIEHHVHEEESTVFDLARQILNKDEQTNLGQEMSKNGAGREK